MKHKLLSFFVGGMILTSVAFAQERKVSGRVTGADGKPLAGVTIAVQGSNVATQTDSNGNYSLSVPIGKIVVFRSVGFADKTLIVKEGQSAFNVTLEDRDNALEEVVVTAMGVSKQSKALGYAATTVKSDEITAANNMNAMTGLQGKVAGVSISNSGTTGGSTKVIIRGVSSFSANNPLYVVDGVPINNGYQASIGSTRSVDLGNAANDINPDDIESMTILKGASATALYGSRAAHGVIMITTKKGKLGQNLAITYNGAINVSNVLKVPQTQNVFGQGWPDYDYAENGSWGPKLDGITRPWGSEVNGVRQTKPYSYVKDNIKNFYVSGLDATNALSISGGGDKSSYMFSYGNFYQQGVLPGHPDKLKRNNFSFRGNTNLDKFTFNYGVNYVRRDLNAIFQGQGSADGGKTTFQELIQTPVDIDLSSMKDYNNPYYNYDNYFTPYSSNPYKALLDNGTKLQEDRFYGNIDLSYKVLPWLTALGKLGGDFGNINTKDFSQRITYTAGSNSAVYKKAITTGRYGENYRKTNQIDATFMFQVDKPINDDISLSGNLGYNFNQRGYSYLDSYISGLNIPGWYSLKNTSGAPVVENVFVRQRLMGLFADATFNYKNYWFVNGSFRSDWSSTLPVKNNNYMYGGINTSLILTDAFQDLKSDNFNYLKLRAAWGKTGNDASPYRVQNTYASSQLGLGFGNIILPLKGTAGLQHGKLLGNDDLKPEITTELEFGAEMKLFNNRVSLDASYYNRKTVDQIYSSALPPESGFTTRTRNIGDIRNKGVEIGLNTTPLKLKDFQWDFGINFTKNNSKVEKLWDEVKEFNIYNAYLVDFVAEIGQPLGVFKVPQVMTVKDGEYAGRVVVGANGVPLTDPNTKRRIGKYEPDFVMGFNTKFTYKDWSLGGVLDWRKGGFFYSYTAQLNYFVGNATNTTFNERQPWLVPNSVKQSGNTYVENDTQISVNNQNTYWNPATNNSIYEQAVLKRDFVKLREVVLTYSLPKSVLGSKIKGVDFSLIGRNLFIWTPKNNNFVDPESSNYGNDITSNFGEFAAGPTFKSFGGSVKVRF
ncbi:SusC/RagA family TonB-linked outer membrane protein [Sphingobacterium sp. Lzh-3]|uniref:SusC/RagA family TonB-linked outer membrane protein n=1 Tax=Sphingobacterium sp. Lzh-3 TaxID=3382150 RepID=UPI00398CF983